ncbi:MAG: WD40 repeat domain-containing protein [Pseudomonadota bacterium]
MYIKSLILITLLIQTSLAGASPPEVDKIVLQLGHSSSVKTVAFSPDGKTVLLGNYDGTIKS